MQKRVFYTELAYVLGIVLIAFSAAIMQLANFGMSMIVSLPYILHVKLSETVPFFSFGMAEYCFQALLIVILMLVLKRFRISYLMSFVTAVIYGFILDGFVYVLSFLPEANFVIRIVYFVVGVIVACIGVAFVFHTYISPEAYELFVKELSDNKNIPMRICKTSYDVVSCVLSVILSFAFFGFGKFIGVNIGTIITAIVNGTIITYFSGLMDKKFEFKDGLNWRPFFMK